MFLIVHGWATDCSIMAPLAGSLARGCGCETASVNLPDYSVPPRKGTQPEDYSSRLAELIAETIPAGRNFSLIGWSMGAMLALEYALDYSDNRLESLVLISGCGRFVSGPGYPDGVDPGKLRLMKRGLKRSSADVLDRFYADIFSGSESDAKEFLLSRLHNSYRRFSPEQLTLGLEYLENTDLLDRLANLVLPVLLIHGSADIIIRHTLTDILQQRLPQAESVKIQGAGHAPFLSRPAETTEAIIEFRAAK